MPATIRIIHAHDFIKANPQGVLDLEESKKLLIAIASASVPLVDFDILLDTRKAHSNMSEKDLLYLASELKNHFEHFPKTFPRTPKTAVLCPVDQFDSAKFFALCAQHNGFQTSAFTSIADAYEWLILARN